MTEHANAALGWRFELPDDPDVLTVLRYDSKVMELMGQPVFILNWEAAKAIITGWQCEAIPDLKTPLDKLHGQKAARIVEGVGLDVSLWRKSLGTVAKN